MDETTYSVYATIDGSESAIEFADDFETADDIFGRMVAEYGSDHEVCLYDAITGNMVALHRPLHLDY